MKKHLCLDGSGHHSNWFTAWFDEYELDLWPLQLPDPNLSEHLLENFGHLTVLTTIIINMY